MNEQELLEQAEVLAEEAVTAQTEAEELRVKADGEDATDDDKSAAETAEQAATEAKEAAETAKDESDSAVSEWEKSQGKKFNPLQAALEEERSKRKSERDRADDLERRLNDTKRDKPKEEKIDMDTLLGIAGVTEAVKKIAREEARSETFAGVAPLYTASVEGRKEFLRGKHGKLFEAAEDRFSNTLSRWSKTGILTAQDVDSAFKDAVAELTLSGKLPSARKGKTRVIKGKSHEILGEEFSHAASSETKGRGSKVKLSPQDEEEKERMGLSDEGYARVKAKREKLAKEKK